MGVALHDDEGTKDVIKRMPTLTSLPVADIEVPADRLRIVGEAKVLALMEVIPVYGFIGQITVRRAGKKNTLIDGAHRLEAMRRLKIETIPAEVLDCNMAEARQLEITGNLMAGMTPLQDAIFLAEWQRQYEEMHPETRRGVPGGMARQGQQENLSSFAAVIAQTRQITPRQVNKIVAAARRLDHSERVALQASPNKLPLKEIEALGKINDPEARAQVIRMLSLGDQTTTSAARRRYAEETGEAPVQAPDVTRDDKALQLLRDGWNRCSAAVRRKFATEFGNEIIRWSDGWVEPDEAAE